jgi:hypothetical protein
MKLFKIYLILFAIVVAFVLGSRLFSPAYVVKETIVLNKPLNETFAYMSNLKKWEEWSLWNKSIDSTLYFFYTQKTDTLGSRQYITGNLIGKGFIEIVRYTKDKEIAYKLWMREGEHTANGTFTFTELPNNQTELAWTDSGNVGNNPIKRYMLPLQTKSTQETFKKGLLSIKAAAEKQ